MSAPPPNSFNPPSSMFASPFLRFTFFSSFFLSCALIRLMDFPFFPFPWAAFYLIWRPSPTPTPAKITRPLSLFSQVDGDCHGERVMMWASHTTIAFWWGGGGWCTDSITADKSKLSLRPECTGSEFSGNVNHSGDDKKKATLPVTAVSVSLVPSLHAPEKSMDLV